MEMTGCDRFFEYPLYSSKWQLSSVVFPRPLHKYVEGSFLTMTSQTTGSCKLIMSFPYHSPCFPLRVTAGVEGW